MEQSLFIEANEIIKSLEQHIAGLKQQENDILRDSITQ